MYLPILLILPEDDKRRNGEIVEIKFVMFLIVLVVFSMFFKLLFKEGLISFIKFLISSVKLEILFDKSLKKIARKFRMKRLKRSFQQLRIFVLSG
jgi:hypothetical protein